MLRLVLKMNFVPSIKKQSMMRRADYRGKGGRGQCMEVRRGI